MKKVSEINQEANFSEMMLRICLDAKAKVKLRKFDRRGKSRVKTFANDHDFSKESLVPFSILLPVLAELLETVLNFSKIMTSKGKHSTVTLMEQTYEKGFRLKPKEMEQFEARGQRLSNQGQEKIPDLGKWFVDISWDSA